LTRERWDLVLKVLDGPLAAYGEQVYKGPVVRLGANPGAGGLKFTGYRGLDARQAVFSVYEEGDASVAPVGTAQVRMAPHANVNWKEIDPMSGPEYLSKGCAIHLGPVGRGATLVFVECRKLGVWTEGELASDAADVESSVVTKAAASHYGMAAPTSYQAKSVRKVSAANVPVWFVGCLFVMAMTTVVAVLTIGIVRSRSIETLGPVEEGEPRHFLVQVDKESLSKDFTEGMQQGFYEFVMKPNIEASGRKALAEPENWDQDLYDHVLAQVQNHVKGMSFFRRIDGVRKHYWWVVGELREAELPEAIAAVPYRESLYRPNEQSVVCAKGYWQIMPEWSYRLQRRSGMDFVVKGCKFKDQPGFSYTPDAPSPPRNTLVRGPYMLNKTCRIPKKNGCVRDDRTDRDKSTEASIETFLQAWEDQEIRESGAAVQMTIATHNAGYDDGQYGKKYQKKTNVLIAYRRWMAGKSAEEAPYFYGKNLTCPYHDIVTANEKCGGKWILHPQTQHYAYTIIAEHLLAVCYYAENYPDEPVTRPWQKFVRKDGYCKQFKIPSRDQVVKKRSK